MSQLTRPDALTPSGSDRAERRLAELAGMLAYPVTPDVAAAVRKRLETRAPRPLLGQRWAWAAIITLVIAVALWSVPTARAAILEFLQIGDVRIFFDRPTAAPTTPASVATPPARATDAATESLPIDRLAGVSSLAEIKEDAGFEVRLPTYPLDLGAPEYASRQEWDGEMVILVWPHKDNQQAARLILYILDLGPDAFAGKFEWRELQATTVNGQPAFWVQGQHYLQLYDDNGELTIGPLRTVLTNVLVWQADGLTYRLESGETLEEAIRIAESMR
jgi:hypothetical protein